jgi:hypothetical protein
MWFKRCRPNCQYHDVDPKSWQVSTAQNPRTVAKVSETVARNHQITLILMVTQLHLTGNSSDSPWQLGKEEDIHQILFNHSPG